MLVFVRRGGGVAYEDERTVFDRRDFLLGWQRRVNLECYLTEVKGGRGD